MSNITYRDLIAPAFYDLWNDVWARKYPEIWLAGGRGCVDASTLIETPRGKIPISEFKGGDVYSYDTERRWIVKAKADRPQRYTEEDLFEVKVYGGDSILVTDEHKFLTPWGWKMTKELRSNEVIALGERLGGVSVYGRIERITFKKRDFYWDMNVDGTHNYIAHGFINHNSNRHTKYPTTRDWHSRT